MKYNPSELLRKLQFPAVLATAPIPVLFMVFSLFAPHLMGLVWVLPAIYAAMAVGSLFISGELRKKYGLACCIVLMAIGVRMAWALSSWWMVFVGGFYSIVMFAGLRFAGWEWYEELPPAVGYIGCGLFAGIQMLMMVIGFTNPEIPERMHTGMTISFLIFTGFTLLSLNRRTLNKASLQLHRASSNVRNKNRTMVLVFFLIVTMIVGIPAIFDAVLELIRAIVGWLTELFAKGDISIAPGDEGEGGGLDLDIEYGEVTKIAMIFKEIFTWIVSIAMVLIIPAILVFGVTRIQKLIDWLNKVSDQADRAWSEAGEDYEEEITNIRDATPRSWLRGDRDGRIGFLQERKLPPGERVRNRYGKLQTKHKDWSASSTARENIPVEAASVYERARYSDEVITEADAQKFAKDVRKI